MILVGQPTLDNYIYSTWQQSVNIIYKFIVERWVKFNHVFKFGIFNYSFIYYMFGFVVNSIVFASCVKKNYSNYKYDCDFHVASPRFELIKEITRNAKTRKRGKGCR